MTKEQIEELEKISLELRNWLIKNFNPYTAILITDKEVKVVSVEGCGHYLIGE